MTHTHTQFLSLKWFVSIAVVATLGLSCFGGPYRSELMDLSKGFAAEDPAVQYDARRSLELVVAAAAAPGVKRGLADINSDLLYCLKRKNVSDEAKKYMLRQLALVGNSRAVPTLTKFLLGSDAMLGEAARKALDKIEGPQAAAALRRGYADAEGERRKPFIRAIARRSDTASVAMIRKTLAGDDAALAREAAFAVGRLGDSQALSILEKAYSAVDDGIVKVEIENSLLSLESMEEDLLVSIFENSSSPSNRRSALSKLVAVENASSVEALEAAISDADRLTRSLAIRLAAESGRPDYSRIALGRANEMNDDDLAVLLSSLGAVDKSVAERIAIRAFDRGNETLMALALDGLGEYGSSLSIDLLLSAFGKKSRVLQTKAAVAIAKLSTIKMDRRLSEMLASGSLDEVETALELLEYRQMPRAKERILALVAGEDPDRIKAALRTLASIASESDLERLEIIAEDAPEEPRGWIVAILKKLAPDLGSEALQARVAEL